jgi:HAD superfamily hydrolase (TIGR01509 family)
VSCSFIFDFDGVLVNTMEVHFACYGQALAEAGVPIDRARFFSQAGMTGREQIAWFARAAGKSIDVEAVYRRKNEIAREHSGEATPIPANIELLRVLRAAGHKAAVASGSSRPSILPVMAAFGIVVDALVTSEDVKRGKPHPDLFLTAAERLGARPADCIVVEDSDVGIECARNAGMMAFRFFDLPREAGGGRPGAAGGPQGKGTP